MQFRDIDRCNLESCIHCIWGLNNSMGVQLEKVCSSSSITLIVFTRPKCRYFLSCFDSSSCVQSVGQFVAHLLSGHVKVSRYWMRRNKRMGKRKTADTGVVAKMPKSSSAPVQSETDDANTANEVTKFSWKIKASIIEKLHFRTLGLNFGLLER